MISQRAYCPNIYTVILGQKLRKCVLMNWLHSFWGIILAKTSSMTQLKPWINMFARVLALRYVLIINVWILGVTPILKSEWLNYTFMQVCTHLCIQVTFLFCFLIIYVLLRRENTKVNSFMPCPHMGPKWFWAIQIA